MELFHRFLLPAMCSVCLAFLCASGIAETGWSEAKRARAEAAGRQRRVIFNDDSEELAYEGANTVDGFLALRLKPLVGTHVDTISWSVLGNWGDAPSYDSKVQPIHGDAQGGPPPGHRPYALNLKAVIEAGHCPLQIVVDFAHDNGMEAFASMRMNDVHDSFVEGLQTRWKKQHPELLVATNGMLPARQLYVTAQDFAHEEVRKRKLEIIEEIAERYDIDGFELDYIRHPVLFSRVMRGEPAAEEETEIMTSLMRRIRQLTEGTAARRGRPILVAARVPDTAELSANIGLDVRAWLAEDLVDILIVGGGYAPFTLPPAELTEMAHQYGVMVYPCINQGPAQTVSDGAFLECVRALAANWYQAGADGIYIWNLAVPFLGKSGEDLTNTRQRFYACLSEIGDPRALAGKAKLFCVDGPVFHHYTFVSSEPPLPVTLKEGVVARIPLVVGDDVEAATGLPAQMTLTMKLKGPAEEKALLCRLNDVTLMEGEFVTLDAENFKYEMSYPVTAHPLKMGRNFLEISLKTGPTGPVQFNGVRLKLEYQGRE